MGDIRTHSERCRADFDTALQVRAIARSSQLVGVVATSVCTEFRSSDPHPKQYGVKEHTSTAAVDDVGVILSFGSVQKFSECVDVLAVDDVDFC